MTQTFYLTNPKLPHKEQAYLDKAFAVVSHSGLHPTEGMLISQFAELKAPPKKLLIAGNRTGAAAMIAATLFPDCAITCHAFDLHHARAIERNLLANGFGVNLVCDEGVTLFTMEEPRRPKDPSRSLTVACTAAIPPGPYDTALMMFTVGMMTTELAFDQLEGIHRNLADGGICYMAAECDATPLFKQYKAVFGGYRVIQNKKRLHCVALRKSGELAKPRDFSATFTASLQGLDPIELVSLPGVFCHRRPDMGGLALAEVARNEVRSNIQVLDMGCGCGLVGCLLTRVEPSIRVTFLDSHARAIAATARNIRALGIQGASLVLADEGFVKRGYDLFVGNPPYYSDFRIADVFLETAFATLHRGGVCLTVAKTANALVEHQQECFGSVTQIPRRGYQVLKSVRAAKPR
jgi:16S rRNA G1207 methylase RsmC